MAEIPQSAYDSAAAVFSRSFRFVEWKYVMALKGGNSAPFGDRGAPPHKAVKDIDRPKWVYVFSQDVGATHAPIKEEIRVEANGQMFAMPWDKIGKPITAHSKPVALGTTLSLPRRQFGKPKAYRFYASRVRLPPAQITALEHTIHTFAPRTRLDPENNTSVIERDGQWLVPVVDPLTVALHLHAAFTAAANDLINYTAAHPGLAPTTRKNVELRRKKHLLATILKGIIGDEKNVGANNLVHRLQGSQHPLETFLTHYDQQIEWRLKRRDWLANMLERWLRSDAMSVAAAAHKADGKDAWVRFLAPWCHVLTRLCETPVGRDYLASLLDDKGHFVHTYIWPQKELSSDELEFAMQAVRKGGMAIFEGWAAIVEARVFKKGGDYVPEVVTSLRHLRRFTQGKVAPVRPPSPPALTEAPRALKKIKAINRTIEAVELIHPGTAGPLKYTPGPAKTVYHFSTGAKSLGALIESVNLIFAIKATEEALQGDDPKAKELALISLVGSTLDASSAVASLMKQSKHVVSALGFVSGVIDVYLGVKGMDKAFKQGDQDIANGQFVIASGATLGVAGTAMGLLAIPGGPAVMVLGLAVVAIGQLYNALKGKPPLEQFFQHCSWGEKHHMIRAGTLKGHPDWSPKAFEQWTGDQEFDNQLEALLNIICKVEISFTDTFRDLKFKAGWLPLNSKLLVCYQETWQNAKPPPIESEILFTHKGPASTDGRLAITPDGQNGVKVKVVAGVPTTSPNLPRNSLGVRLPAPSLERVLVGGRLLVTFEGALPVKVPYDRPVKKTFP